MECISTETGKYVLAGMILLSFAWVGFVVASLIFGSIVFSKPCTQDLAIHLIISGILPLLAIIFSITWWILADSTPKQTSTYTIPPWRKLLVESLQHQYNNYIIHPMVCVGDDFRLLPCSRRACTQPTRPGERAIFQDDIEWNTVLDYLATISYPHRFIPFNTPPPPYPFQKTCINYMEWRPSRSAPERKVNPCAGIYDVYCNLTYQHHGSCLQIEWRKTVSKLLAAGIGTVILGFFAWLIYGSYIISQTSVKLCYPSLYNMALSSVIISWLIPFLFIAIYFYLTYLGGHGA